MGELLQSCSEEEYGLSGKLWANKPSKWQNYLLLIFSLADNVFGHVGDKISLENLQEIDFLNV